MLIHSVTPSLSWIVIVPFMWTCTIVKGLEILMESFALSYLRTHCPTKFETVPGIGLGNIQILLSFVYFYRSKFSHKNSYCFKYSFVFPLGISFLNLFTLIGPGKREQLFLRIESKNYEVISTCVSRQVNADSSTSSNILTSFTNYCQKNNSKW